MLRREFIIGGLASLCLTHPAFAAAAKFKAPALQLFTTSPWLANGIAVAPGGESFINLPRFQGHLQSPALARITASGPVAFPGNQWNSWQPGEDGIDKLVNVNACHIFDDGLLWVVDQGAPQGGQPARGAAKLAAFDIHSGELKQLIRFDEQTLPEGSAPNDLRIHGNLIYVTDSGSGGIIIHDLKSGRTSRRLSGSHFLRKPNELNQKGYQGRVLQDGSGKRPAVHSDVIEVTADGVWLYYATPTGPLYRIRTADLNNSSLDDAALESRLEKITDIPSIGGSAIDKSGNIYLSSVEKRSIDRLKPNGETETLIKDERLITPDALFIADGWVYVPAPQIEYLSANNGGKDDTHAPWAIYCFRLTV